MKTIDCRSEEGVTIGLIDSLISISRILRHRDLNSYDIKEALRDLYEDEDAKYVFNYVVNGHCYNDDFE